MINNNERKVFMLLCVFIMFIGGVVGFTIGSYVHSEEIKDDLQRAAVEGKILSVRGELYNITKIEVVDTYDVIKALTNIDVKEIKRNQLPCAEGYDC